MHGVILSSLREFVGDAYGGEVAARVFAGEPTYLVSEAYDDEPFEELLRRLEAETSTPRGALLHAFGVHTARGSFARLYPAFFEIAPTTREFLLTVETRIHELVRATIPHAEPPRLRVTELDGDGVSIEYDSERRLCDLLRGLVDGTAAWYGERAEIAERQCMLRGGAACVLDVRLSPS